MTTRERAIYRQMKAEDERQNRAARAAAKEANEKPPAALVTPPFEEAFFFPTPQDVRKARQWLKKPLPSGKMIGELSKTGQLRTAFTLVAQRVAVPAAYLEIVRGIEARIEKVRLEQNAGR
jgi:hypothetical protein